MVVEVQELARHFGPVRAVDGVSFTVQSGQICGFIGPNGAGKTTAMRIMATLDLPDAGDVRIDGVSVLDYPDRARPRLGFMPDYYGAYPDLTVREYLDFFARTYRLRGRRRTRAVRDVMAFTALDVIADKEVRALSKGMRQRLSLGRALIHDPELLILDEPAAGLDPRARIELRELLRELAADGKGVFISSHILTELGEMCDTVVIIERGRVRAAGRLDEIKQSRRSSGRQGRAETSDAEALAVQPAGALEGRGGPAADDESPPAAAVIGATVVPSQRVRIQLLRDVELAERVLHEQPDVANVSVRGSAIHCEHRGDGEEVAGLLSRLIGQGLPVVGFQVEEEDLEDLFMALTDGEVQ